MVNGRNKGAQFERQIAADLHAELGIGFKRNLEQTREAGHADLIPDDPAFPFTLELKRYKEGPVGGAKDWWLQVQTAANREGKIPALIFKYDRQPIRCVIPLDALVNHTTGYVIEMDFTAFCYVAREMMNEN